MTNSNWLGLENKKREPAIECLENEKSDDYLFNVYWEKLLNTKQSFYVGVFGRGAIGCDVTTYDNKSIKMFKRALKALKAPKTPTICRGNK